MTEEPQDTSGAEEASAPEAAGSAKAEKPKRRRRTRAASDADASSTPAADETVAKVDADEAVAAPDAPSAEEEQEPAAEVEVPKRRRSPRRRQSTEPAAETAGEEPAAQAPAPAPPSAPAPRRRRSRRQPGEPAPVVRAQAKYVRSSARKARLVCDHLRGKSVDEARAILAVTPRAIASDWSKLLESAVANAEHNHELVGEDLYVKAVHADEGPTIKRFRPRAMGRATRIRKRTSHLTILLTPKD